MGKAKENAAGYSHRINSQSFWKLYPALVVAAIIPALSGLINGLIVGNAFSPVSMAAVSFSSPIVKFIEAIAVLFSSGAGIAYGRYLGRGESENLHKVFSSDIAAILIIGIALTLIGEVLAVPISRLAGADGESLAETAAYLRGIFIGIVPLIMMPSLVTFLNLGNEATYGMLSSLVLAVFNMIFGLLNVNVFHMGMFGMGLATSLAQYLSLGFLLLKFIKRPELGHMVKQMGLGGHVRSMVIFGAPASAIDIACAIRNTIINTMTNATGGTLAVAGLGILNSSAGLFCAVISAMIAATSTLVSICVGENDRTSLYSLVKYLLKVGAAIFLADAAVYVLLAPQIAGLFGATGEGMGFAVSCIRLYSLELLTGWFVFVIIGTYQSLGRSALSVMFFLFNSCIYAIIAIFFMVAILPQNRQVYGVWSCYGIAMLMGAVTLIMISWLKSGHFPCKVEYLLWLNDNFGVADENRIAITVRNMDEVMGLSRVVQDFCLLQGIDRKRSMEAALCIEEMAGNIISHGFTKKKTDRNLSVNIYVSVKDGEIFMRIRDNAPQFDPFRKLEMYRENEDDPAKNIGIRMVSKIAREMKYQTTLGMNVLTIAM